MRGRRGLFSLFTSLPEHAEDEACAQQVVIRNGVGDRAFQENKNGDAFQQRRRRRHSSGGDRGTWTRKVEYFFAGLGYAVGLGNIWRFPYLCYRNGGGAFLIPYVLVLLVAGFPMIFMEMSFGQFASLGTITIWRVCPLFKGIGYAIIVVLLLVNTYYNVLIAYSLFFLFASITNELPWASCDNDWNTDKCTLRKFAKDANASFHNISIPNDTFSGKDLKTPTEEYFENHVLNMTSGIDELGTVSWPLIVCLGVSWFVCFMCLFKGIKSMGKAVIFTTVFSYVILTVLLIRGVTLEGAYKGLIWYLKPDWRKLATLQVWGEASAQVFASLSLGGGGWITLSSYNKFNNKCNRDAILVGLGNALTSIYSGFVIFSVLGYMSHVKGVEMDDVTIVGPGLAFVAYPEGLATIPGAPFWSICFFFMMFTVGLDSLFGQVETIAAGFIDEFPEYLRPRRKLFTLFLCCLMFFMGIPLVTQGGVYVVTLMDWYTLLFSFTIISLCEVVVIIYIYGYKQFCQDIEIMIGVTPSLYYKVTWLVVAPITMVCVIAFLSARAVPAYLTNYEFPQYATNIGWCVALLPVSLIPFTMLVMFALAVRTPTRLKGLFTDPEIREEIITSLIHPTVEWGPALPENFRRYSMSSMSSIAKKHHPSGDTLGEDDVFGGNNGAELVAVKPHDDEDITEKDRLVRFEDEKRKSQSEGQADEGQGQGKVEGEGEGQGKVEGEGEGEGKDEGQVQGEGQDKVEGESPDQEKAEGEEKFDKDAEDKV